MIQTSIHINTLNLSTTLFFKCIIGTIQAVGCIPLFDESVPFFISIY